MFKKVNKVALTVAAVLSSTSVLAVLPNITPDIEIWMSGASAQDNAIAALFTDLCATGTIDVYKDGVAPNPTGSSHFAYYCEVDVNQVTDGDAPVNGAMATWIAGHPDADPVTPGYQGTMPKVLVHKRAAGGSAQGVNPVLDETAIAHMVINNDSSGTNNCLETAVGSHLWACNISGATYTPAALVPTPSELANTTLNTMNIVSDAGVSDVNPELFVGANVPAGFGAISAANVAAKLNVVPGAALVFGIPVSVPLYEALQRVQGKTVGAIDETNMPSLSKAEVASIMAGKVKNWNAFKAGPAGQGLRDYAVSLGAPAPASTLVNICRRVNGSGTQAQMSAKFLHYPCTAGALAPVATSNTFTGPVVFNNSSSGNVDTCLNTAGTLGAALPSATSPGNNRWAVGLQSLEKNFLVAGAYPLNYRFVKIDGVAPTLANAANGKYFDWVENTFQWRKVGGTGIPALVLKNDKLDIVSTIVGGAGKASIVRDVVNPAFVYGFGQSGYLALDNNNISPAALNVPSYPFAATNPVIPYTHTFGGGLDNCRSPVLFDTAGM